MSVHWNILCLIWINLHCIRNYDKFAKKHGFYPIVCAAKIQGVLITMITYCAGTRITARLSPFVEQWVPVSAGHSTGTAFMLHCCSDPCAGVHWTRKLASIIMSQSKDWIIQCAQRCNRWPGVSSQNFRHWPAETRANQQLDSAEPGHVELSDQSATKKTDVGYQSRWRAVPMLNFVWTNSVCKWSLLLLSLYVWVISMHFVKFRIVSHAVKFYAN